MLGLLTGGVASSRRGPGQCGNGGRGQVSAAMPKGLSCMVNSE